MSFPSNIQQFCERFWAPAFHLGLISLLLLRPIPHTAAAYSMALFLCIAAWIMHCLAERRLIWVRTPLDLGVYLYVIAAAASLPASVNVRYSLGEYKAEVLTNGLLFFLVAINVQKRREMAWYVAALGVSIFSVAAWEGGLYFSGMKAWQPPSVGYRATSYFNNFSRAAFYVSFALPPLLGFFWSVKWKTRLTLGILAACSVVFLVMTYSRASWLSVFIAVLLIAALHGRWKPVTVLVIGAVLAPMVLPGFMVERMRSRELGDRVLLWESAGKMLIEHPWTGIGFGDKNFRWLYPDYLLPGATDGVLQNCHNVWLQKAVEMGFPGAAVFLFLVASAVMLWAKTWRKASDPFDKGLLSGVAGSLTVFSVFGCFAYHFENENSLLFWVLLSILVLQNRWTENREQ